ncbi:MAG: hypothetical protein P4L90_01245, partial [Rhodopila sp.]|nr:hypothetical protein [Rhodopila sp.]
EVQANAKRAGSVELLDRNRMRGYVTQFAPYDRSDEGDDANWIAVLAQALAHNAEAPDTTVPTVPDRAPDLVQLPFPTGTDPDLLAPLMGDLRGGMPSRIGGNTWCRMVDEDTYRLHATGLNADATRLVWTGVHLPPNYVLTVRAACAIEESLPVRATLMVVGADGLTLRSQHVFTSTDEQAFSIVGPAQLHNPLTVSLYAEPLKPLNMGERAVIDISPIRATWSEGAAAH